MKHLITLLNELAIQKIETSEKGGSPIIQTTLRTKIKNAIEQAVLKDIQKALENADFPYFLGETSEGIILALENESLVDKSGDIVGEIPFEINIKVKNLDYNTEEEIETYQLEQEEKAEQVRQAEIAKQAKIKNDALLRAKKAEEKRLIELAKNLKATE